VLPGKQSEQQKTTKLNACSLTSAKINIIIAACTKHMIPIIKGKINILGPTHDSGEEKPC
jgi:hypothetical protein